MESRVPVFARLRTAPGMFLLSEDRFDVLAGFVMGYDMARDGGVLIGFREWLALRLGHGTNLAWPALVLEIALARAIALDDVLQIDDHRAAVNTFWQLWIEFEAERLQPDPQRGLRKILVAYDRLEEAGTR